MPLFFVIQASPPYRILYPMKPLLSKTYALFLVAATMLLLPLFVLIGVRNSVFAFPENIKPSEEFCIDGYFLFPSLYKIDTSIPSERTINSTVKIFDRFEILSRQICIKPTTLLEEKKPYNIKLAYLGNSDMNIFQNQIEVKTDEYPSIEVSTLDGEISRNEQLTFDLSYDNLFLDYILQIGEENIKCQKEDKRITCNTQDIPFEYGQTYKTKLLGMYNNEIVKIVDSKDILILHPVTVESSSIGQNGVVSSITIPEISLTLNKEIKDTLQISIKDESGYSLEFASLLQEKNILIQPKENFKQSTSYTITVSNLEGIDGSKAENDYTLSFSIGDGPKITGSNMKTGFSTGDNIVLTFNQDLKTQQDIKKYITINSTTEYSYSIKKNQITINPTNTLNTCTVYKLDISKGLTGTSGLVASTGSSHTFKTRCYRVVSLGTSVQGRNIYAYYFGNGSKKILFFASMHGSESNTKSTMTKWIDELEINSSKIPSDKTVIVIPTLNPDGVANKSRFNANGVDLNRNFAAADWAPGTYLQSNFYPTGGGISPFSEPESLIMKNLLLRESPYISLSYHSAAGYVVVSNTAKGIEMGQIYSQLSKYRYIAPTTHDAFSYDITGTFEGWAEEQGYSSLVIELSSAYTDQFLQNKSAMWKMVESN